jgi:hypothetical protein
MTLLRLMGTSQFQALRSLSSTLIIWPQNSPILIYAKKIVRLCQIAKMFDSDCDPDSIMVRYHGGGDDVV